jgi:hypothetical protein
VLQKWVYDTVMSERSSPFPETPPSLTPVGEAARCPCQPPRLARASELSLNNSSAASWAASRENATRAKRLLELMQLPLAQRNMRAIHQTSLIQEKPRCNRQRRAPWRYHRC